MKPEEQRIAIAEACGWSACGCVEGCKPHGYPPDARKPTTVELLNGTGPSPWDIPDYLNDLNAMHEAEKTLNQNLAAEYARMLTSTAWQSEQPTFAPMTATAAQRAEAFLRTINKWEETTL